jgi:hypothetical protein
LFTSGEKVRLKARQPKVELKTEREDEKYGLAQISLGFYNT